MKAGYNSWLHFKGCTCRVAHTCKGTVRLTQACCGHPFMQCRDIVALVDTYGCTFEDVQNLSGPGAGDMVERCQAMAKTGV
jgi:hypothetical protein